MTLDILMKRVREVIELCLNDENNRVGPLELISIQQISV
jgi:predicted RNase H-like HicB family nuclease